jgi:hypothetical protein
VRAFLFPELSLGVLVTRTSIVPEVGGGGVEDGELFSAGFTGGDPFGDFRLVWNSAGGGEDPTVVDDVEALDGKAVRFDWNSGLENDKGMSIDIAGSGRRKIYVRIRYKMAAGANNSGIKKVIRVRGTVNGTDGVPLGTLDVYGDEWIHFGDDYGDAMNHFATAGLIPDDFAGSYHWLEYCLDYSDLSKQAFQIWTDGELALDDEVTLGSPIHSSVNLNLVAVMTIFNTPADNRYDWVDKVDVSASFMGVP